MCVQGVVKYLIPDFWGGKIPDPWFSVQYLDFLILYGKIWQISKLLVIIVFYCTPNQYLFGICLISFVISNYLHSKLSFLLVIQILFTCFQNMCGACSAKKKYWFFMAWFAIFCVPILNFVNFYSDFLIPHFLCEIPDPWFFEE